MSAGKVNNMNIISDPGAVSCVVVIAKDAEFFPAPDRNLCDEGKQVVGNAVWVFTNLPGRVCANRIEVAKIDCFPFRGGRA